MAKTPEEIKACRAAWRTKNAEKIRRYRAETAEANKAGQRERSAKHYELNRERCNAQGREYHAANRERCNARSKAYRQKNRAELSRKDRERYQNNPHRRLAVLLRTRLNLAIRNGQKGGSAVRDLGCTVAELKLHLEAQFVEGMNWDTHGIWHIDHIKPLASFDLTDRDQFLQACHYTNLQPLWAEDNLSKGDKLAA